MNALLLALPDPLVWQAGLEYGLQALAALRPRGWRCAIASEGQCLEPVVCGALQLGLRERIDFGGDPDRAEIVIYPRIAPMSHGSILRALGRGQRVITSDPSIAALDPLLINVPRRDWRQLAAAIESAYTAASTWTGGPSR